MTRVRKLELVPRAGPATDAPPASPRGVCWSTAAIAGGNVLLVFGASGALLAEWHVARAVATEDLERLAWEWLAIVDAPQSPP